MAVKLTVTMTILVVVAVSSVTVLSINREQQTFRKELEQQADMLLDTLTAATADQLYYLDTDSLSDIMEALGKNEQILTSGQIYDAKGRVIADAYQEEAAFSFESDPLGQRLLNSDETVFEWQPHQLVAGRSVRAGNQRLGAISVGLPTAPLQAKVAAVRNQGFIAALATIVVGGVSALLLNRSATGRLQELVQGTTRIAKGDLTREIAVRGSDELAVLGAAMEGMRAELQELYSGLEKQVAERTAELTAANEQLQQEIVERKQAENALRESQRRLEERNEELNKLIQAMEQSANTVIITDLGGNIEYVNPKFVETSGYTVEEALRQNTRILKSGMFSAEFYEEMWRTITSGQEWHGEFLNQRKDGTLYWEQATIAPVYDRTGQMTHFIAVKEDITARKEAEEALREREQFLELLNDITRAALETPDLETMLQTLAGRLAELFAADSCYLTLVDQATQTSVSDVACGQWRGKRDPVPVEPGETSLPTSVLKAERSLVVEDVYDTPYLSRRIAEIYPARSLLGLPLIAGSQKLGVAIVAFIEPHRFTDDEIARGEQAADQIALAIAKAQLVETLQEHVVELQARNEELDAFAHTVAHDLKNPVGIMVSYAETLEQMHATLEDETQQKFLHTIARHGRKMSTIIDELLLLASLRAMGDIEVRPLDMGRIVAEALDRLRLSIEAYQAKVIVADNWPVAFGYGPWIEAVWANYISNALKYGGQPPRIDLGFTILRPGSGQVLDSRLADSQDAQSEIRFWVRDNGPGLSPEEQARLFTPFERLHQVRVEGHGLGLSIVQRILDKLGGRVGVESAGAPGQGCTFYFILPNAPPGEK